MYVSVFEQKAMSKFSMSPAFIMYVSVFEQKAMSKCSMSPALLCTYCIMYVSVFEQKAMSKCSMSPALFDFFSNNSKFMCFLPAKFEVNALRYPSMKALMNYKEQNVHILCPGLSKYF